MTRVYVYTTGLVAFIAGTSSISNVRPKRSQPPPTTYYKLGVAMDLCQAQGKKKNETNCAGIATAMIVASITEPNWVSYSVTTTAGETLEKHIGLHKSCSSLDDPHCRDFPSKELCQYGERYFCSMWRTVGFMASFTIILCLASLIAFALVMNGGRYRRETGWPFVSALLTLVSVVEFIIISIVVGLISGTDRDKLFKTDWCCTGVLV